MNIIIAIFLYLGLTYPGDYISKEEIDFHKTAIQQTATNPDFLEFYDQMLSDGICTGIDIYAGE